MILTVRFGKIHKKNIYKFFVNSQSNRFISIDFVN